MIVKPLEWDWNEFEKHHSSALSNELGSYYITKESNEFHPSLGDNDGGAVWYGDYCKTLNDAKIACQNHYDKTILDALTEETKQAIAFGFASLKLDSEILEKIKNK
jgi:hypothetical protein